MIVVKLPELKRFAAGIVRVVESVGDDDPIARRLSELGFVPGESVRLIAVGPFGADPLLVQVGFTRFALRRSEAARVTVQEVPV
jgi:ferrous iron transport protein A